MKQKTKNNIKNAVVNSVQSKNTPKRSAFGFIYSVGLTILGIWLGVPQVLWLTIPMLIAQGILFLKATGMFRKDTEDTDYEEEEEEENENEF